MTIQRVMAPPMASIGDAVLSFYKKYKSQERVLRIRSKQVRWEGKFLRAVELAYEGADGVVRPWEAVERVGCDGIVIAVPITREGQVVLIRQYRPVLDRRVVEFPAGLVESGEDPMAACGREIIEETGYAPQRIEPLRDGVMSTGINSEMWHVYLATGLEKAPPEVLAAHRPDDNEEIEVITCPPDGVYEKLLALESGGDLVDLRVYGLYELAKARLKEKGEDV